MVISQRAYRKKPRHFDGDVVLSPAGRQEMPVVRVRSVSVETSCFNLSAGGSGPLAGPRRQRGGFKDVAHIR